MVFSLCLGTELTYNIGLEKPLEIISFHSFPSWPRSSPEGKVVHQVVAGPKPRTFSYLPLCLAWGWGSEVREERIAVRCCESMVIVLVSSFEGGGQDLAVTLGWGR